MLDPLLHVALWRPKIPQNTGNIGRLALGMRARLHLIGPLGFRTDERACRRAGLDYWKHLDWQQHDSLDALRSLLGGRIVAFSTRAERYYTDVSYEPGDCLLFGDEVKGLPRDILDAEDVIPVRIPVHDPHVRSFNLANAVAMALGESMRQLAHPGAIPPRPRLAPREEVACRQA